MTRSVIKGGAAALIAAAAIVCAASASAQPFALKDGQTVVFYGDSITALRLYTRDVEEFVLTRYPALHIHFETQAFLETRLPAVTQARCRSAWPATLPPGNRR